MKKIYVIHENDEWLIPLRESFKKINAPYEEWHMNKVKFDYKKTPPEGIFYNRMSASSHSRGHRYAPENTKNLLSWLEKKNKRIEQKKTEQEVLATKKAAAVAQRNAVVKAKAEGAKAVSKVEAVDCCGS